MAPRDDLVIIPHPAGDLDQGVLSMTQAGHGLRCPMVSSGRVLLVDPIYKPDWDLPGGMAEANEPPADAVRRELREELGLDLQVGDLLCVDWVSPMAPGTTSSTSSSMAEPSRSARSPSCNSSTVNCEPSSSATKARPRNASAPTSGAGQARRWKRWAPAGHGICRTGTPKPIQERCTSLVPGICPSCTWCASTPTTTHRSRRVITRRGQHGFSTGPGTMGNNRHLPDNRDTRTGRPTHRPDDPPTPSMTREIAGQRPNISPSATAWP